MDAPDSRLAPPPPPRLSVIIPAYNEAVRLGVFLPRVLAYLERTHPGAYEVLVVDDGSIDQTADVVRRLAGARALLALPANRGKGAAVKVGMLSATGALRLFADADGATPIEEEAKLRAALVAGVDVAIGSRAAPGGARSWRRAGEARAAASPDAVTWEVLPSRHVVGRAFALLTRLITGVNCADTQCGFKMFRAAAARDVFGRLEERGYAFDVEALVLARQAGYVVAEIPVRWADVAGSKVRVVRDAGRMLRQLLRIRRRLGRATARPAP